MNDRPDSISYARPEEPTTRWAIVLLPSFGPVAAVLVCFATVFIRAGGVFANVRAEDAVTLAVLGAGGAATLAGTVAAVWRPDSPDETVGRRVRRGGLAVLNAAAALVIAGTMLAVRRRML